MVGRHPVGSRGVRPGSDVTDLAARSPSETEDDEPVTSSDPTVSTAPAGEAGDAGSTAAASGRLEEAVTRLAHALRQLDVARLRRPPRQPAVSGAAAGTVPAADAAAGAVNTSGVADLAHALVCRLALLQQAAGDVPDTTVPVPPRLGDHAAGDQVEVVGRDAVAALRAHPDAVPGDLVDDVSEQLRALRLRL